MHLVTWIKKNKQKDLTLILLLHTSQLTLALLALKIHGTTLWNKIMASARQIPTIVGYTTYTVQNNHCENVKGLNPGVIS